MAIWQTPSGREFFDGVFATLFDKYEHCAVVLPEYLESGFVSAFSHCAGATDARVASLDPDLPLMENIAPEFAIDNEKPRKFGDLVERHLGEGRILILRFPAQVDKWRREYREFISQMAAYAKEYKDSGRFLNWSLVCVAPPGSGIDPDSGLAVMNWWGRRYPSDMEFAIERALRPFELKYPVYIWRYAICRGLCDSAPELASLLAPRQMRTREEILDALKKHEFYNPRMGSLAREGASAGQGRGRPPSGKDSRLWQAGIFDCSCQGKPVFHPAALLAANFKNKVINMVIAGQMQIYLPLVQEVCQFILRRMRTRFGEGWIERCDKPPTDIGPLAWQLGAHFRNVAANEERLAKLWRDVRNRVAHASFLDSDLALKAMLEYERAVANFQDGDARP